MQVSVKLFSFFRQYAGVDQVSVDLTEGASVADLLSELSERFQNSAFKEQKTLLMVNNENALPQRILKEGDAIHLLPILGGG